MLADGAMDDPWSCWWQILPEGTRVAIYRISDGGLLRGSALATVSVADALRFGLDNGAGARSWLSAQFGPGRYRFIPRDAAGVSLKGSGIDSVHQDVAGLSAAKSAAPTVPTGTPGDPVELRRLELEHSERQADKDREARLEETRLKLEMERLRVESEDRRRREDRETEERRRVEEQTRQAAADERRRQQEAEERRHQEMLTLVRESTKPRDDGAGMALMMKMIGETQANAASGMLAMVNQISQGLIKQAVETATKQPAGGGLVSELVAALPAAAKMMREFRLAKQGAEGVDLDDEDDEEDDDGEDADGNQTTPPPALPAPAQTAAPVPVVPGVGRIRAALGILRMIQSGEMPNDAVGMRTFIGAAPSTIVDAIRNGDDAAIQAAVAPALDADLTAWLSQPEVTTWLMGYLAQVQAALVAQTAKRKGAKADAKSETVSDGKPPTPAQS
jgi:hypothetical protein